MSGSKETNNVDIEHVESPIIQEVTIDESTLDSNLQVAKAMQYGMDLDDKAYRRVMRKVDFRLMPALGLLYAWSLIDRVNLSSIQIGGMAEELGTDKGNRYTLITMIFFVTYVLLDYPSNLALRRVGPRLWLGFIGFTWGCLTIAMGFARSWVSILICRVIFGALESGLSPGCIYLLSCWYPRYDIQKRFGVWAFIAVMASGISSLLVYAIEKVGTVDGLRSWRWVFIIEGIVSASVGVIAGILLVDFPDRAARPGLIVKKSFLTPEEVSLVLARLQRDRGDAAPDKLTFRKFLGFLADWKIWEFAFILLCNNCSIYAFSYFLPQILQGSFGYSLEKTYVLNFPPYALAAIWMLTVAFLGDKYKVRGPIIMIQALIIILGVCLMAFAKNSAVRYFGVFLGIGAINANMPAIMSYQHNNITGQLKRALATAILVGGGGFGGIVASLVFRQQDAPLYLPGLITVIVSQCLTVAVICKNFVVFRWLNAKADRGEIVLENSPDFRYTY
ncbi:phthalate transporter [Xylogone sp. PMI_703]|nr:phthalate transporter [Xylogone sp. PMI_703]